jgi:ParB family chromosome partitioning protein
MREFALLENIQREDLNPIELAYAYNELLELHKITHEELSKVIHKSRTHITNSLRLLQLSKKTQKAIIDKKITAGHAKVLVGLDEKQENMVVNSIIGQKLSVREVEAIIKNIKQTNKSNEHKEFKSYNFSELKERLNTLGFKTKVQKNKITLEFENEAQIEKFVKYFDF